MFESYQEHIRLFGEKNTTIERKNNNDNYCKENCGWATRKEQALNRRSNVLIDFQGEKKPLKMVCGFLGVKYQKVWDRINRYNWSISRALYT